MTCKYIVEDLNTNTKYEFYTVSKFDTDYKVTRVVKDGLKEGEAKYKELIAENKSHKIIFIKVYPDYKSGQIETKVINTNV